MLSKTLTFGFRGIDGYLIEVEVDISSGLPSYNLVGLPDTVIKESRDRINSAIRNSGFDLPNKKITVNLAPAEIKKAGTHFDLPIAIGILIASGNLKPKIDISKIAFIGELALDGKIRPVIGALPMLISMKEKKLADTLILPAGNYREAEIANVNFNTASNLREIINYLNGEGELKKELSAKNEKEEGSYNIDFSEVKGQRLAMRAMEIAVSGFHNIIMIGPPGSGKSMMAKRICTIMPPMSQEEIMETTKIYSVAGLLNGSIIRARPFRDPHHTISDIALIGGGQNPRPGEVSLAHNGVLFLDEFTEFSRQAIETLRQPLENRKITISRVKESISYPANFLLVAASNPCPCGYYGHPHKECICTPIQIQKYRNKISGPVMDRIDIQLQIAPVNYSQWKDNSSKSESSADILNRVIETIDRQRFRYKGKFKYNSMLTAREIAQYCKMPDEVSELLSNAMDRLGFSARSMDRIAKLSRTIADMEKSDTIKKEHVIEALQYRFMDRPLI